MAQADARGEFLNAGQMDALAAMAADGLKRMDAVNRITSNASKIVTNAARDLFEQQPALIAPGGIASRLSTETVAVEVVRALAGTAGVLLAMPLATASALLIGVGEE